MLFAIDLAVIFVITIIDCAASFELKIKPVGEKFIKAQGFAILFTCEVTGTKEGEVRIQWLNNLRREILDDTTKRIYVEQTDAFSKKLYITSIQKVDAGRYFCIANSAAGQQTKVVELAIYKDITFDHVPNPQHPAINTTALIECKVSGSPEPEVSWRYNGKPLDSDRRYTKLKDGLQITNITLSDGGNYTCRAEVENEGRYDERPITVAVHTPPRMTEGPGFKEVIEGKEVTLSCRASGHPLPKFEFYKNKRGEVLSNTDRISIDADAGRITFRPVTRDDAGEYLCKAHNDVGVDEKSGELQVLVPPRIHELHNITGSEHEMGTLICRATGHPSPEMHFQKEGNRYPFQIGSNEGGRVHVSKKASGHLELTIRNLAPSDATNYTCLTENTAGRVNKTAIVDVHFRPRFGEDNKRQVYSWAGARHNISCHVQAQPSPEIKWIRYGRQLANNETFQIFHSGKQSNLQVRIKETDQSWVYGDYICRANNSKGVAEERFQLSRASVPDKPQRVKEVEVTANHVILKIDPPRENGGVGIIGYRVEFENSIQDISVSEPSAIHSDEKRPNRNWYKNATTNQYPDAEVSIVNLRPGTKYVFRIRAKNEVGVGSSLEHMVTTGNLTNPFPIMLTSLRDGGTAHEYQITWATPRTGGLPIKYYEFRYRKVRGPNEDFSVKPEAWKVETEYDDPEFPIRHYWLHGLAPETEYQLEVIARNDFGASLPNEKFLFRTTNDDNPEPTQVRAFMSPAAGIGIALAIFLIILIIVDISCYFLNGCGFTMFVCVHVCEKLQVKNENEDVETGNGKVTLKQSLQPVEEGKTGCRPDMTELQEVEEGNEDATVPLRGGGSCAEEDEKKAAANRKSVLSQGDERWKDVVQELEKELSIKRSMSENESQSTLKLEKPEILISEEPDVEMDTSYQLSEPLYIVPEQDINEDEEIMAETNNEDAPVEEEAIQPFIAEEKPTCLLQENEEQTLSDEKERLEEEVEPAVPKEDEESEAKNSINEYDYELLMRDGDEAKSTVPETQSLIEEECQANPNIQQPMPIGADWDNSFLQDDDQLDLMAEVDDQRPLLDENLFPDKDFSQDCSESSNNQAKEAADNNLDTF